MCLVNDLIHSDGVLSEKLYHIIFVICHFLSISASLKPFSVKLHMREYNVVSTEASASL